MGLELVQSLKNIIVNILMTSLIKVLNRGKQEWNKQYIIKMINNMNFALKIISKYFKICLKRL